MFTRYDLMKDSPAQKDIDNESWPDPLTVDYTSFVFTEAPFSVLPDDRLQSFPYLIAWSIYKFAQYEDIVFGINNVPHVSKVQSFTKIDFPTYQNLLQYFGQQ